MEKEKVKKLHHEVDEALKRVAAANGFTYKSGTMRYGDLDVRGKMEFILAGHELEVKAKKNLNFDFSTGLRANDIVTVNGKPDITYKIIDFTTRGTARMIRQADGNSFISKPMWLKKS